MNVSFKELVVQSMLHLLMVAVCGLSLLDMYLSNGFWAFVWWIMSGVFITTFLHSVWYTTRRLISFS